MLRYINYFVWTLAFVLIFYINRAYFFPVAIEFEQLSFENDNVVYVLDKNKGDTVGLKKEFFSPDYYSIYLAEKKLQLRLKTKETKINTTVSE